MAEEYFGMVRWNEDELRNALEENDVRPTDERVAQLRKLCCAERQKPVITVP